MAVAADCASQHGAFWLTAGAGVLLGSGASELHCSNRPILLPVLWLRVPMAVLLCRCEFCVPPFGAARGHGTTSCSVV